MTSQPGKQTITIYTFSNLSGSKGNQKMKFSGLVGHNKRNFFLEKTYTNMVDKPFPEPFLKNQN